MAGRSAGAGVDTPDTASTRVARRWPAARWPGAVPELRYDAEMAGVCAYGGIDDVRSGSSGLQWGRNLTGDAR